MNWSASCAHRTTKVFILVSQPETRSKEHLNTFVYSPTTSFIAKHQSASHSGQEPSYKAKVACTRDCLTRQVREAVLIRRSQHNVLNGKSEWHQPALYRVQQEVEQG